MEQFILVSYDHDVLRLCSVRVVEMNENIS